MASGDPALPHQKLTPVNNRRGQHSAQVGELKAVVLAAQNQAKAAYVNSYSLWAGATQWLSQWEVLNWEINRSPVWRTED